MSKTTPTLRLNRFISNSGLCTRREADELIKKGEIKVNGKVEKSMGVQVRVGVDKVTHLDKPLAGEQMKFILINKPPSYVVQGKGGKSIFALLRGSCDERVYPVNPLGVLEMGLQLFTNDEKLRNQIHSNGSKESSLYHITFSVPIPEKKLEQLRKGVKVKKGVFKPKEVVLTEDGEGRSIGLMPVEDDLKLIKEAMHVLRLKVEKLDRVLYAGLTKKNLPRGKWKVLSEKEVSFLRMSTL